MKHVYFFTGFPGFLANELLKQLIIDHRDTINCMYLLVLPPLQNTAIQQTKQLANQLNVEEEFFQIISGDITENNLQLSPEVEKQLRKEVTHVFHLAAIYDLAVTQKLAYNVNVKGTEHVNNWVKTLSNLERYIYYSTAYVSGTREGKIYEYELDEGQHFRNHYEETKFLAEMAVHRIKEAVPTTIVRPAVVKGHSKTGYTIKFDGLYFMLNFLDKIKHLPQIPYLGEGKPEGNFIPSDYLIEATSYLAINPIGAGKTYHLTDPKPYKMWELQKLLCEYYVGKTPKGKIPIQAAKLPMTFAPIRKRLQAEPEAMDYFLIHSSYDCTEITRDLEDSCIICPDLVDTLEPMITFYQKYKDDYAKHPAFF